MKEALGRVVEEAWVAGFALAGRRRAPVTGWSSPGGQRVLVVAPHPDDEAIGCAGTLIRHVQSGDAVRPVIVSDGRRSRALGLGPEEMAARRQQEAVASARAMGTTGLSWLGWPEGEGTVAALAGQLGEVLESFAPDIVYAPSRVDFHPEHYRVAHALALALEAAEVSPAVRVYAIQVPLTGILANVVADVSGVADGLRATLAAYVTQAANMGRAWRQRRYAARFYGYPQLAEAFWQVTAGQYIHLHCSAPEQWPAGVFYGLRERPFSDPLAYRRGRDERRRLLSVKCQVSSAKCQVSGAKCEVSGEGDHLVRDT